MRWHVPPTCQGQIVEVAYCQVDDGGMLLRRTTDTSLDVGDPGRVVYDEIPLDDDEVAGIEPRTVEPSVRGEWRRIDAARLRYWQER